MINGMTKTCHFLLLRHSTERNLLYPIRIDHIIHAPLDLRKVTIGFRKNFHWFEGQVSIASKNQAFIGLK